MSPKAVDLAILFNLFPAPPIHSENSAVRDKGDGERTFYLQDFEKKRMVLFHRRATNDFPDVYSERLKGRFRH